MDHITPPFHADPAHAFVVEVLRTGLMLADLVADLLESTPAGAFPGEDTGDVLVSMLAGTVRPAVEAAGAGTVEACTALLGALGAALGTAVGSGEHREPALVTFVVSASSITALGVSSAFWGLLAGLALLVLQRFGAVRAVSPRERAL